MTEVNFLVKKGLTVPKGSAATPAIIFDAGDTNTGIYSPGADQIAISTSGTAQLTTTTSSITTALPVDVPLGSAAAPTLTFTGDTDTGIYSPGADQVAISASGVSRLRIANDGRLVIGNDAVPLASTKLFVKSGTNNDTTIARFTGTQNAKGFVVGTFATGGNDNGVNLGFGSELTFSSDSGERARIDDSGRLLVGTNSSSSSSAAVFQGSANSLANANVFLCRNAANPAANLGLGNLNFGDSVQALGATVGASTDGTWASGSYPTRLAFSTTASGVSSPTERMRLTSDGKLLVGTSTAPAGTDAQYTRFAVRGNTQNTNAAYLSLGNNKTTASTTSGDNLGIITFNDNDSDAGEYARIVGTCDGTPGLNDYPGRLVFSTTADGASSPTERMRITSDGFITTNPNFTATSSGSEDGIAISTTVNSLLLSRDNSAPLFMRRRSSDGEVIIFRRDTTVVGTITVSTTATAYNTSSDYRLKENVTPVTDGITRLQQLKPSRFNFIADPTKTVDGFLAHEVQTIVPEAITGEKDAVDEHGNPQYQGIDQSKLVPLLTAALQEAIGRIETLEAEVAALKAS